MSVGLQVPAMLLPMTLLAWRRGELGLLWHGHLDKQGGGTTDESERLIEPPAARDPPAELPV